MRKGTIYTKEEESDGEKYTAVYIGFGLKQRISLHDASRIILREEDFMVVYEREKTYYHAIKYTDLILHYDSERKLISRLKRHNIKYEFGG